MIKIHKDLEQGSDEWLAIRCGVLTASEMHLIVTASLKVAANDKERAHLYELVGQRITKFVEPRYLNDNMLRGTFDEPEARAIYNDKHAPVTEVGFITNDDLGFIVGYSPDGLVGDDGLIEIKSKKQSLHTKIIISGEVPTEHIIQIQTGLFVSGRHWCDFISYSGGMPLFVKRVYPDLAIQGAIKAAAIAFENRANELIETYNKNIVGLIPTERVVEQDIQI